MQMIISRGKKIMWKAPTADLVLFVEDFQIKKFLVKIIHIFI